MSLDASEPFRCFYFLRRKQNSEISIDLSSNSQKHLQRQKIRREDDSFYTYCNLRHKEPKLTVADSGREETEKEFEFRL